MSVRVSGKHMDIGDSFRQRIESQITDAIVKYYEGGSSSQVIVEKSSAGFSADCRLHLDTGVNLHATGQAAEPQAAFDAACERLEKRLRRYKRKLRDHHAGTNGNSGEFTIRELARIVLEITGSKSEIIDAAMPADDPKMRKPDISLAKEILYWVPVVDLRAGLARTIAYFAGQPVDTGHGQAA